MGYTPAREITRQKYMRIQERYKELYQVKRLRHDDVIETLKKEFFITQTNTIYRILNTEVTSPSE
jgi:hypothetical protein